MQNQMAAQMAMNANGGPVDGTPNMGNMPHPGMRMGQQNGGPAETLNTYIYDYFLRNNHLQVARAMLEESDLNLQMGPTPKPSPKNRSNGADSMDSADDFPVPKLPQNQVADNSFLHDWWVQFWDIFSANRSRTGGAVKTTQYIGHTRNLAQMQNEQRNQRMMMNNPMNAQYQNMMRNGMVNGAPKDLQRAAAMNNRPNGNMPNMGQMKNPAMMAAQMQRDGSTMDMNGQRPQSPGSNENAPSPNKRPRMEGGMTNGVPNGQFADFAQSGQNAQQKNIEVYAQSLAQQHRVALNSNTASPQGINSGVQGSPMAQLGLEGHQDAFAGNTPRQGPMPPNGTGAQGQGNHALQDYQMQLMLLEQQNKKRLLMARQEQDNMSGPQHQGGVGAPGFPASLSPQNRPGPSPNPEHQKMRGTPKLGMPGSPLPEGMQQRGSPAPNMQFGDASMAQPGMPPQGMPPQFYPQMPHQSPMMRPPSSHPGANFQGQVTPQQLEAMRQGGMPPNGAWRGNPQQSGMMPQQMGGPMGQNPQQQRQMPPPPAPANEQPRPEPSPSVSNQAPPTPSSTNKAGPKKKGTKDNAKKPAGKKGANAGATPAATNGEEPPTPTAASTPAAPITPHSKQPFPQNGQQQQVQPQNVQQQHQQMDNGQPPFGNIDGADPNAFDLGLGFGDEGALENFDFDSFLQNPNDDGGFQLGGDFDFNHVPEVGGLD